MNWKTIIALAALVAPIAYCTAVDDMHRRETEANAEIECIKAGRVWGGTWGRPYCREAGE